jgi:hypothetical protein
VPRLGEQISPDRLEVDFVDASGPVFAGVDVRRLNLELVLSKLTRVVAFESDGRPVEASRALYKRAAFLLRDEFLPVRDVHRLMLNAARDQLAQPEDGGRAVTLAEISLTNPLASTTATADDLLARLDGLATAGLTTLVTDFEELFRVAVYLRRYAVPRVVFVVGTRTFGFFFGGRPFESLEAERWRRWAACSRARSGSRSTPSTIRSPGCGECPHNAPPSEYHHLREYLFANGLLHELSAVPLG